MNLHKKSALAWFGESKKSFINNEWRDFPNLRSFPIVDPTTEQVIAELPEASAELVDVAVEAARHAFQAKSVNSWAKLTRRDRGKVLISIAQLIRDHADELAAIETLSNGKTFAESRYDDIPEAADVFNYYAGWTDKFYAESIPVDPPFVNYTVHEPIGVVALIVPWNFPLLLACWKLAPALAMGNTVILKPASNTSHSLIRLMELIHQAQILPPGVINLIYGDQVPGEALSRHPDIDKISFTGSTAVGRRIVRGASESNLKTITLELGGKSPNIIFADCLDLEAVLQRSFTAMFCHKGEKCSEPTRFLIERSIYNQAASSLKKMAQNYVCGDPFDPATQQGPQANRLHCEKIWHYINKGQAEGAELLTETSRSAWPERGFFVPPTIFSNVNNQMTIAREEIFGPVLCLIPFDHEDEAISIANDSPYGLAAGVYTGDASKSQRVASQLNAGMIFINHYGCYDFASPFGGFKQSGWGKEMAIHSLAAYTKTKSIWMKY